VSLGSFSFDSSQFGNSLGQSDGGSFAATNWLNVINTNPGSPAYLTGANFDTGISNIGLSASPVYTIGYNTPITNGPGADLGVVTARFSSSDTIDLTINGNSVSYGPALATSTSVFKSYFYGGTGPYDAILYVTLIDLSDFAVSDGASVNSIAVTGSPELDLVRIAGLAVPTEVPLPATIPLFASGLGVLLGLLDWRRKKKVKAAA